MMRAAVLWAGPGSFDCAGQTIKDRWAEGSRQAGG